MLLPQSDTLDNDKEASFFKRHAVAGADAKMKIKSLYIYSYLRTQHKSSNHIISCAQRNMKFIGICRYGWWWWCLEPAKHNRLQLHNIIFFANMKTFWRTKP